MDEAVTNWLSELRGRTGGHSVLGSCLGRATVKICKKVYGGRIRIASHIPLVFDTRPCQLCRTSSRTSNIPLSHSLISSLLDIGIDCWRGFSQLSSTRFFGVISVQTVRSSLVPRHGHFAKSYYLSPLSSSKIQLKVARVSCNPYRSPAGNHAGLRFRKPSFTPCPDFKLRLFRLQTAMA